MQRESIALVQRIVRSSDAAVEILRQNVRLRKVLSQVREEPCCDVIIVYFILESMRSRVFMRSLFLALVIIKIYPQQQYSPLTTPCHLLPLFLSSLRSLLKAMCLHHHPQWQNNRKATLSLHLYHRSPQIVVDLDLKKNKSIRKNKKEKRKKVMLTPPWWSIVTKRPIKWPGWHHGG